MAQPGLLSILSGVGSAVAGYDMSKDIRKSGAQAATDMTNLGKDLAKDSAFRGYGMTTGLGQSTVDTMGNTNLGVSQDPNMLSNAAANQQFSNQYQEYGMDAAGNSMMDTGSRERDIYNRAMAMQQPQLDQQRAAMNAREFAQGRGGVRGSQFGGTAEDAAMARAHLQAQNAASFEAMNQAQQEMMNQGNLANIYGNLGNAVNQGAIQNYQASFLPIEQQLNALQVGGQAADRFQTGQLTGTGYGAQLGLGGIQSQVNADKAASELFGNVFGSGMNAIGAASGMFSNAATNNLTGNSTIDKILSYL